MWDGGEGELKVGVRNMQGGDTCRGQDFILEGDGADCYW